MRGAPVGDRTETGWVSRVRLRPWPYFGGLALASLAIQAATGVLMAFTYQPTPDQAYVSSYYIANVMPYGWLVRTIHSWGAHLAIVFAAVHAVRVFVNASYKRPRGAKWAVGVLSLLVMIAMAFTGNLLPWDQGALRETTSALSLFREAPLVGDWIADVLVGGAQLGAATLTRFFAAHATVLPAALVALLVVHLRVARRSRKGEGAERSMGPEEDTVPLYPDLAVSATTSAVLLLSLFAVLSILVPATLDAKADVTAVSESSRPSWYFLSLYSLSRYLPPPVAATATVVLGALFALLPSLDRGPSLKPRDRALALAVGTAVIVGVVALTLLGTQV